MGQHGTNKTARAASMSGGGSGDGEEPTPQVQDHATTDYEPDWGLSGEGMPSRLGVAAEVTVCG
ncbi:hypothetical protein RB200_06580 [Streptomyces sp. PmtG]